MEVVADGVAGHEDEAFGGFGMGFGEAFVELGAAEAGHFLVADEEVVSFVTDGFEGGMAVCRDIDRVAIFFEDFVGQGENPFLSSMRSRMRLPGRTALAMGSESGPRRAAMAAAEAAGNSMVKVCGGPGCCRHGRSRRVLYDAVAEAQDRGRCLVRQVSW